MKKATSLLIIISFFFSISVKSQTTDFSKMNVKETVDFINKQLKDPQENIFSCTNSGDVEFKTKFSVIKFNIKDITIFKYNTPMEGWFDALLYCTGQCVKLEYELENKNRTSNEGSFGGISSKATHDMVAALKHLQEICK
ncbi:MAG: hypothetical protein K9J13_05090 [Saprospiraceae bacterium]|nr:hypothetical protein [Saprospiraceae bacterium]